MAELKREFWARHPGLAWSNPEADNEVRIRAALLRPRFERLLNIALQFGLEPLQSQWRRLLSNPTRDVTCAQAAVERILANIEKGFRRADS